MPWGITGDTTARGLPVERFVVLQYRTLPTYTFKESERVEEYLFAGGPGPGSATRASRRGKCVAHKCVYPLRRAAPLPHTLTLPLTHSDVSGNFEDSPTECVPLGFLVPPLIDRTTELLRVFCGLIGRFYSPCTAALQAQYSAVKGDQRRPVSYADHLCVYVCGSMRVWACVCERA